MRKRPLRLDLLDQVGFIPHWWRVIPYEYAMRLWTRKLVRSIDPVGTPLMDALIPRKEAP